MPRICLAESNFATMKRIILFFLVLFGLTAVQAQVIVDLKKGGPTVKSKTLKDYDHQGRDERALREDSVQYVDCLRRAFNALATDSLQQAEALFKEALHLRPDAKGNYVVWRNLGLISLARVEMRQAIERFTKALLAQPGDQESRYNRAKAYFLLNNFAETIADCDFFLKQDATNLLADSVHLLRAAAKVELRQYAAARAELTDLLTRKPNKSEAHLLLLCILQAEGRLQEMRAETIKFCKNCPNNKQDLVMFLDGTKQTGDIEEAKIIYDALLEDAPDNGLYRIERAKILLALGQKQAAREDLKIARRSGIPSAAWKELEQKLK